MPGSFSRPTERGRRWSRHDRAYGCVQGSSGFSSRLFWAAGVAALKSGNLLGFVVVSAAWSIDVIRPMTQAVDQFGEARI